MSTSDTSASGLAPATTSDGRLNGALLRCISNHSVNTLRIAIGDIVAEESTQVARIEYNHVIEDLAPA